MSDQIFILTEGGPGSPLKLRESYIYRTAFRFFQFRLCGRDVVLVLLAITNVISVGPAAANAREA